MDLSSDSDDSDTSSSSLIPKNAVIEEASEQPKIESQIVLDDLIFKKLVQRIHCIVSSFGTCECSEIEDKVKNFLTDVSVKSLFIFQENDSAKSICSTSNTNLAPCTYFIKISSYTDINENNLLKNTIFGNIDSNFERVILLVLKCNFACILYRMEHLPSRIRLHFTRKLENFLCHLAEIIHMKNGLSHLYLPVLAVIGKSGISTNDMNIDDILTLYENVIVQWYKQLNGAIYEEEIHHLFPSNFTISDILQFWQCKGHNLQQMRKCLYDSGWQSLLRILHEHNSAHVGEVCKFLQKLYIVENEIIITYQFLCLLEEFSRRLDETPIRNIPQFLPDLWILLNVILQESQYFHNRQNLLLNGITQQIMNICVLKIEMKDIQLGNTEESMCNLTECVRICSIYRETLVQSHLLMSNEKYDLLQIAHRIDLFIKRCIDILNLCSSINIFSNLIRTHEELQIKLEYYVNIKVTIQQLCERFFYSLKCRQLDGNDFLGLFNIDWFDLNKNFNEEIGIINDKIKHLVETSFQFVSTAEDAIDILCVTFQFYKLPPLKFFFCQKYNQIIDLVSEELREIDKKFLGKKLNLLNSRRLDNVYIFSFRKKRRIQYLFRMLKTSKWLKQYNLTNKYKTIFEESIREMNFFLVNEYKIWLGKYENKILKVLMRPLLTKCSFNDGLLQVNIHRRLLKVIKDACYWVQIGFDLLPNVGKLVNMSPRILYLYAKVEMFVLVHNRIFMSLTTDELLLFQPVIRHCKDISRSMLSYVQWDNDNAKRLVTESLKQIQQTENLIFTYKSINSEIIQVFKSICVLKIEEIKKTNFEEIVHEFIKARLKFFYILANYYNEVCSRIQSLLANLRNHFLKYEMKLIWMVYIKQLDMLLESALKCCLKNNLLHLLNRVRTSYKSSNSLMKVKISVEVVESEIYFKPKCSEIFKFYVKLSFRFCEVLKLFPRLTNKFKIVKISKNSSYASILINDQDITNLQAEIETTISKNLAEVEKYIQEWNQYKMVWKEMNENFEPNNEESSDVNRYEILFKSYKTIIEEIHLKKSIALKFLFEMDLTKLKSEIISQSEKQILHLGKIIKKNALDLAQKIKIEINEENTRLSTFDTKNTDSKKFIDDILQQKLKHEKEILKIREYVSLSNQLNQDTSSDKEKLQDDFEDIWRLHTNMIDRCLFKNSNYLQ